MEKQNTLIKQNVKRKQPKTPKGIPFWGFCKHIAFSIFSIFRLQSANHKDIFEVLQNIFRLMRGLIASKHCLS